MAADYEHDDFVIRRADDSEWSEQLACTPFSGAPRAHPATHATEWLPETGRPGRKSPGSIVTHARSTPDVRPRRADAGGTETADCDESVRRHGRSNVDQRRRARGGRQSFDALSLVQEGNLPGEAHLGRLVAVGHRKVVCNEGRAERVRPNPAALTTGQRHATGGTPGRPSSLPCGFCRESHTGVMDAGSCMNSDDGWRVTQAALARDDEPG